MKALTIAKEIETIKQQGHRQNYNSKYGLSHRNTLYSNFIKFRYNFITQWKGYISTKKATQNCTNEKQ